MSAASKPCTSSELQLYRVLLHANLLSYYDIFIEQGGDDVLQLCEAGEDEFLEIMRLVGMSGKPLHVRRLQKALQDWVLNPGQFAHCSLDAHSGRSSSSCCCCCSCGPANTDRPGAAQQLDVVSPVAASAANAGTAVLSPPIAAARVCMLARAPPAPGSILALSRLAAGSAGASSRSGCRCDAATAGAASGGSGSSSEQHRQQLTNSSLQPAPQPAEQESVVSSQPLHLSRQLTPASAIVVKSEPQELSSLAAASPPLPPTQQSLPPLASFVSLADGGSAGSGSDSRAQLLPTSCSVAAPPSAAVGSAACGLAAAASADTVSTWLCSSQPKSPKPTAVRLAGDGGWQQKPLLVPPPPPPPPLPQQQQPSRQLPGHAADSDDQDESSSQSSEDGSSSSALWAGISPAARLAASGLSAAQVDAIREAAVVVNRTLPMMEVKPLNLKKPTNRAIEALMQSGVNTAEQIEELRRYSAIYGRFDSRRRSDKPVSLHEMSVNEAAAQLCLLRPALLTRRDELFPLARTVVRESGYIYSKGHSRARTATSFGERSAADSSASGRSTPSKRRKRSDPLVDAGDQSLTASSDSCELPAAPRLEVKVRLIEIDQQLKRLAALQAKLTSHLHDVRSVGDGDAAAAADLQLELESLSSQQIHLLSEQMDLLQQERQQQQQQHREEEAATAGYHTDGCSDDCSSSGVYREGPLSAAAVASARSCCGNGIGDRCSNGSSSCTVDGGRHQPLSRRGWVQRQVVRETLFDEGLRIAKQYGLSDLAAELEDMKEETARSRQATQQQQDSSRVT